MRAAVLVSTRCILALRAARSQPAPAARPSWAVLHSSSRGAFAARPGYHSGTSAMPPPAAGAAADAAAPAAESSGTAAAQVEPVDTILQYIVLRRDLWGELDWPLGSVVAQGCHAATAALWLSREQPGTQQYCAAENLDHMHKVVLEIKGETQLRALSEKLAAEGVAHKLWVEQPEDFATCLATAPAPKSQVQPHVRKLKLCKGT